jgi:hypothetical protein
MNLFASGIDYHMAGSDEIPTNNMPVPFSQAGFGAPGFN